MLQEQNQQQVDFKNCENQVYLHIKVPKYMMHFHLWLDAEREIQKEMHPKVLTLFIQYIIERVI